MKYIHTLLEENKIEGAVKEKALEFEKVTGDRLIEELAMNDDGQLMFSNHILALLKRIEEGAFVDDLDEDMADEISEEAWQKAEEAVGWLFTAAGHPVNRAEVFLVATHIQMALQNMKEEKKDE